VYFLLQIKIEVTLAGLNGTDPVKCSRGLVLVPDDSLANCHDKMYDVVVLPGGLEGSDALARSVVVGAILKSHEEGQRYIAAICAAPKVLAAHEIGFGKNITSYPTLKSELEAKYE